jgi:hypothetical protein
MDLRLAMLKAVSFYLLHNVSTLDQCRIYPVAQLCVNTLLATKVTLIIYGIKFGTIRIKTFRGFSQYLHMSPTFHRIGPGSSPVLFILDL